MATFGARPGPGGFAHELVTTPGLLAVVDGVIAGVLAAILTMNAGLGDVAAIGSAIIAGIATVGLQLLYQYRVVVAPRGSGPARFPDPPTDS